jgi:TonB family protein
MFKSLFLFAVCGMSSAWALPSLVGTVADARGPIDGAKVTLVDSTGKSHKTTSSKGEFSVPDLPAGYYMFVIDADKRMSALGAVHLTGDQPHKVKVMMRAAAGPKSLTVGAAGPLRQAIRPAATAKAKSKPAQLTSKLPPLDPTLGFHGVASVAVVVLADGSVDDLVVLSAPNQNAGIVALQAVRQWQYSPATVEDKPVESALTASINFGK